MIFREGYFENMEIKVIKGKKKFNKNLVKCFFKATILVLIFYMAFMLINQYVKINNKKENLNYLSSELKLQKIKNDELKKISEATDEENEEYFVKTARKLNLSKHNERIFVNISGN